MPVFSLSPVPLSVFSFFMQPCTAASSTPNLFSELLLRESSWRISCFHATLLSCHLASKLTHQRRTLIACSSNTTRSSCFPYHSRRPIPPHPSSLCPPTACIPIHQASSLPCFLPTHHRLTLLPSLRFCTCTTPPLYSLACCSMHAPSSRITAHLALTHSPFCHHLPILAPNEILL